MKPTNLIQKLAAIRTMAGAVAKNKTGFGYKYSDITEILAKITAGMNRHNVSLIPMIKPDTTSVTKETMVNTKLDKTGKPYENTATEMQVQAEMVFRWVNNDDPQDFLDVPWVLIGSQSDPSQAFGSALTYCTRYFLTSYFQIAQMETDVDQYRSKQKAAEEAESREVAAQIMEQFDVTLRTFLADHPDKSAETKEFIRRYVKSADYTRIQEPKLASKLVQDFNQTFLGG